MTLPYDIINAGLMVCQRTGNAVFELTCTVRQNSSPSFLFLIGKETPIAVFEKINPQYHKFYSFDSLETMHVQYQ